MTAPLDPDLAGWSSSRPTLRMTTAELEPGHIVIADRRPLRILTIRELKWGQWTKRFMEAWEALDAGDLDPDAWPNRPFEFECRWDDVSKEAQIELVDAAANFVWAVLPPHYAVCHLCGELPPCRHVYIWHIKRGYEITGSEAS